MSDLSENPSSSAKELHDLVTWAKDGPEWQSDALRRLYAGRKLSTEDLEELKLICKETHDLLAEGETAPKCVPLTKEHVPAGENQSVPVTLRKIEEVGNVNALMPDQSMTFRNNGLTVVFGGNGSGKSGYVRILKKVCRARADEEILPNIYETGECNTPSATVRYAVGGTGQPAFEWQDGIPSPELLSKISILDSHCAREHVEKSNDAAYTPVPLQMLQQLADACRTMSSRLDEERSVLAASIPLTIQQPNCADHTSVGQLLANLGPATKYEEVTQLARLSKEEKSQLKNLTAQLAIDPARAAREAQARLRRMIDVKQHVEKIVAGLNDKAVEQHFALAENAQSKTEAARVAADGAFQNDPLPNIGGATWKALWEAARSYSEQSAYPDTPFPKVDDGAVCVLCQQELAPDAKSRLVRFEEHVKQEAQKAADSATTVFKADRQRIEQALPPVTQRQQDVSLFTDELQDQETGCLLRHFYRQAAVRTGRILASEGIKENVPGLPNLCPLEKLQLDECVAQLRTRIAELNANIDEGKRRELQKQHRSLQDRVWLNSVLDDVRTTIKIHRKLQRFDVAQNDANTSRVTRKANAVADSLITDAWRDSFQREIDDLGLGHLRLELKRGRGSYGSASFRLRFVRSGSANLGKVLSEGEHRGVALAAFLSELAIGDNKSAIVLDDPVSSLDHKYRGAVADRLVKEVLTGRQIVVFTHDIPFLFLLHAAAKDQGLDVSYQSVTRTNSGAGKTSPTPPFEAQPVDKALTSIENHLHNVRHFHESGNEHMWGMQAKGIAGKLRDCWELATEQVVKPVVRRFANKVHPAGLRLLAIIDDADSEVASAGYGRCSEWAHSNSPELLRTPPTPTELEDEITELRRWTEEIQERQKKSIGKRPQRESTTTRQQNPELCR